MCPRRRAVSKKRRELNRDISAQMRNYGVSKEIISRSATPGRLPSVVWGVYDSRTSLAHCLVPGRPQGAFCPWIEPLTSVTRRGHIVWCKSDLRASPVHRLGSRRLRTSLAHCWGRGIRQGGLCPSLEPCTACAHRLVPGRPQGVFCPLFEPRTTAARRWRFVGVEECVRATSVHRLNSVRPPHDVGSSFGAAHRLGRVQPPHAAGTSSGPRQTLGHLLCVFWGVYSLVGALFGLRKASECPLSVG